MVEEEVDGDILIEEELELDVLIEEEFELDILVEEEFDSDILDDEFGWKEKIVLNVFLYFNNFLYSWMLKKGSCGLGIKLIKVC